MLLKLLQLFLLAESALSLGSNALKLYLILAFTFGSLRLLGVSLSKLLLLPLLAFGSPLGLLLLLLAALELLLLLLLAQHLFLLLSCGLFSGPASLLLLLLFLSPLGAGLFTLGGQTLHRILPVDLFLLGLLLSLLSSLDFGL